MWLDMSFDSKAAGDRKSKWNSIFSIPYFFVVRLSAKISSFHLFINCDIKKEVYAI